MIAQLSFRFIFIPATYKVLWHKSQKISFDHQTYLISFGRINVIWFVFSLVDVCLVYLLAKPTAEMTDAEIFQLKNKRKSKINLLIMSEKRENVQVILNYWKKLLSCEELWKNKINKGRFRNQRQRNIVRPRGTNRASDNIFLCSNLLYCCEV